MNSPRKMAKKLAKHGRGRDKHLLHITKDELDNLASTGLLTRNPKTGLPEAGFFSDIFSFAAPIVGSIFGGPLGAALGGAVSAGVRGENPLKGALTAGLKSYVGGQIGGALGDTATGVDSLADANGLVPMDYADASLGGGGIDNLADFNGLNPMDYGEASAEGFDPLGDANGLEMIDYGQAAGRAAPGFLDTLSQSIAPARDFLQSMPWEGIGRGVDVAGGLYGLTQAQRLRKMASRMDPFGPYRAQYAQQMSALAADPSGMLPNMPGWQAGLTAVKRGLAGRGLRGSGAELAALQQYGGDFYNQTMNQLAGFAGAGIGPGGALSAEATGLDLMGNSINRLAYGLSGRARAPRGV